MKYRWLNNVVTTIEVDGKLQQLYQGLVFEVKEKDNRRINDYVMLGGWLEVVEEDSKKETTVNPETEKKEEN